MDSTDVTEDFYAAPVANAGLVEVYLSTKGKVGQRWRYSRALEAENKPRELFVRGRSGRWHILK